MSFVGAKSSIETYVDSNYSTTVLVHDNTQPDDISSLSEWVRLSIQGGGAQQISFGVKTYRYPGVLTFQIFTKPDIGSGRAMSIADIISPLFLDKVVGSTTFGVPDVITIGEVDDWYQVNLVIPYYRQE